MASSATEATGVAAEDRTGTGADALVAALQDLGVQTVFGLPAETRNRG